jgi:hypothetical protein
MSGLFGKSATINNEATRIGALRVQNSTQGIPIPIIYGKTRVSPNLIDYRNFHAVANTTSQHSGKGGGGVTTKTTTYTYFAAPMLALCEGPLQNSAKPMVDQVWVNKDVTTGANLGVVEFRGTYTQTPWSFMSTSYANDARALRGQAYIAHPNFLLDSSGGLQNLTFELRGRLWADDCEPDVNCALVVPDFLSNVDYGLGFDRIGDLTLLNSYCEAAGFRISPNYNAQRPAAEMLDEVCKIANAGPFWSEGLLKIVPYADTPVTRVPQVSQLADSFEEQFVTGLADYTATLGNAALFTLVSGTYGNAVHLAVNNDANSASRLTRFIGVTHDCTHIEAKFRLMANSSDDAGILQLAPSSNVASFQINPKRETAIDANQRCHISLNGEDAPVSVGILPFGVWFQVSVDIHPGAGATTWVLSTPGNSVTVNSGNFTADHGPLGCIFDRIFCFIDSSIATAPSEFTDIIASTGNDVCIAGNSITFTPDLTVQYALSTANGDFIANPGDPPIKVTRKRQSDAYNVVQVSCLDRTNAYNKAVVEASDLDSVERFGRRVAPVIQADMICELDVARSVAQTALQRITYMRNVYAFTLGWRYSRLEPMDIVTLTEPNTSLNARTVRITAVDEADLTQGTLAMEAEDVLIGISTPGSYATQAGNGYVTNTNTDPGAANAPVIMQPPVELSGVPQIWIGASGGANWGGAEIWASDDGSSYAQVGLITSAARYGTLTANFAGSADPDITNNLSVNLANSGGTLTSVSNLSADSFDTLSWVGAANTPGELIAYTTVTLTAPNAYTMSGYTRRGLYCGFPTTHLTGESFMRLDAAVAKITGDQARVGQTIFIKLRSFNLQGGGQQDLSTVVPVSYVVQPIGLTLINGAVPDTINAGQTLCVAENAQYLVQGRMTVYGRVNLHGRLSATNA